MQRAIRFSNDNIIPPDHDRRTSMRGDRVYLAPADRPTSVRFGRDNLAAGVLCLFSLAVIFLGYASAWTHEPEWTPVKGEYAEREVVPVPKFFDPDPVGPFVEDFQPEEQ